QRVRDYMLKAMKEAKVHTSWINPNELYDQAVARFVEQTLTGPRAGRFLSEFLPFQRRVARLGMINSLSQVLLKMTCPGVPDFYQGTELWDFSLVDPDNRRPVDYAARRATLAELLERITEQGDDLRPLTQALLDTLADGRVKLYVILQTLRYRRQHREPFTEGSYEPLTASGAPHSHVCAFVRRAADQVVVVAVPRLVYRLTNGQQRLPLGPEAWAETWLALPIAATGQAFRN